MPASFVPTPPALRRDRAAQSPADLAEGLTSDPPHLPYRLLWDRHNSALYDRIREQPEYYLDRAEMSLLRAHAPAIAAATGARTLIELGAGSGEKALPLLRHMPAPAAYRPVDLSSGALDSLADRLLRASPGTDVRPVAADFTRPWPPQLLAPGPGPVLATFLGSTLGNLLPDERHGLFARLAHGLHPGDALLLGVPLLLEEPAAMTAAYRDAAGLMETFYLHCLRILNRDFGADFDLNAWAHQVGWNADKRRVEIGLRAFTRQYVTLPGSPDPHRLAFAPDQVLRAAVAARFTPAHLDGELAAHGFDTERRLPDPTDRYMLLLARRNGG
ncbi:L-histidine N(alpha)-methyltransferase [Streptomyces sp. SID14515]|uniref:L-histidine N(alpha)-methyltransferase n=1 Tax=Streptomyces sp. SID14515 TaxID=2706074 RepID=UPI0013C76B3C|nr:L-histidine N(alpha)-methyltransferase [Streptomyces sp. SID14515]NEB41792.1 L-histidine N(alpha)-methyltransferase [Streptomyces sp. SID14515]